jgi:hypothetical protein
MGNVTKSQQNNITSPNGNSLAVFVDGITGVMKVKDIMGNIQPLSDFVGSSSPFEYNANATGIQPVLGTNDASGCYATIGGGCTNTASGCYSAILGGVSNRTCNFANAMIVGSNLCATQDCTTFANCLSADNLTVGCAVSVGANKVLINSPFTNGGGVFAQTSNSTPITATTVESSLIGTGVGTLSVSANAFGIGDSFTGNMSGIMSSQNNDTLTIRVKSGSVILAESDPFVLPSITNQVWNLILGFTIRTLGGVGVASISTFGEMHILKLASGTQEGFGFSEINNTTFNTTISNTLSVTAQWSSNNANNSIYTELFVLTKIF